MALKLEKFVFNPFSENTFVIWDSETKDGAVIDPGCSTDEEKQTLINYIDSEGIKLKYLINTHCHIDHIFGNAFVKNSFNVEFYAPEEDLFLIEKSVEQAKAFFVEMEPSPKPDKFLYEGMSLELGNIKNEFLFTPGHTPGEYCIYFPDDKVCITGDVLFRESIGRTDLWGGDLNTLISSIKTRLLTLPDDVKIYPGHGEESTIGYERNNNPFLN